MKTKAPRRWQGRTYTGKARTKIKRLEAFQKLNKLAIEELEVG